MSEISDAEMLEYESLGSCICPCCGEESNLKEVDFGYGYYEYGSETGVHTCRIVVTECCEVEPSVSNNQSGD